MSGERVMRQSKNRFTEWGDNGSGNWRIWMAVGKGNHSKLEENLLSINDDLDN